MKLIPITILLIFLASCATYNPNDHYEEQRRLYEEIYKAQQERMKAEAELAALKAEINRKVTWAYEKMIRRSEAYIVIIKSKLK